MSVKVFRGRDATKLLDSAPMLAVAIPTRKLSPPEFWLHLMQTMHPLNVKLTYLIIKGKLPAESRNQHLQTCIDQNIPYCIFLDDDVLFPEVTFYRLLTGIRTTPGAACITAIYPTKIEPVEPLIYRAWGEGAYWDWPLGGLVPIHSGGAGCMIVDMEYVKRIPPPWFNDVVTSQQKAGGGTEKQTLGHDRYFHTRLAEEAGGLIYADTGLLCGHLDVDTDVIYLLPPNAPCFQEPPQGEAYVPYMDQGQVWWKRTVIRGKPSPFKGYLDWLNTEGDIRHEESMIDLTPPAPVDA